MARRGWGTSITTALGTAAGAGAAQLGFGYGLGIINWTPPPDESTAATAWTASLIWAMWIAATSTVVGAVCAQQLRRRSRAGDHATSNRSGSAEAEATSATTGPGDLDPAATTETRARHLPVDASDTDGALGRLALAAAAGFGALVTVLLTAVPARVAVVPGVTAPRDVAAGYATVGVLVGVAIAVWALHSRAAAGNVIATLGWLWLLAVVAVVDGVVAGRGLSSAQLGIWQLSAGGEGLWLRDWFYWPGAVLALGSALLIGVLVARRAPRHPDRQVGATASGAAGPLLVAVAYLVAVPDLAELAAGQASAHLIAPYAVIVGFGGSALVTALGNRADRRTRAYPPRPAESHAGPGTDGSTTATPATRGRGRGSGSRRSRTVKSDPTAAAGESTAASDATGASAPDGQPSDASGRPSAPGGARRGRGATARSGSAGGDPTTEVPVQRTAEAAPADATAASTESTDGGSRRARSARRTS